MNAKKQAPAKTAMQATVEAYLIEHGGAPMVTTQTVKAKAKGGATSATVPQFPDPMPTLAQAMKDYPCKGHGDRKPNVCREAKKLARAD